VSRSRPKDEGTRGWVDGEATAPPVPNWEEAFNRPWPDDWVGLGKEIVRNLDATGAAAWRGSQVREYIRLLIQGETAAEPAKEAIDGALALLLSDTWGSRLPELFFEVGDKNRDDAPGTFARRLSWIVRLFLHPQDKRADELREFVLDYATLYDDKEEVGGRFAALAHAAAEKVIAVERSELLDDVGDLDAIKAGLLRQLTSYEPLEGCMQRLRGCSWAPQRHAIPSEAPPRGS